MKINKFLNKVKKLIITIVCCITLVFTMPVKSNASSILNNFIDLLLAIPDGIMYLLNNYVAQDKENLTRWNMEYKGVGEGDNAFLFNFEVTPYDIFTSGLEYDYETADDVEVSGNLTSITPGDNLQKNIDEANVNRENSVELSTKNYIFFNGKMYVKLIYSGIEEPDNGVQIIDEASEYIVEQYGGADVLINISREQSITAGIYTEDVVQNYTDMAYMVPMAGDEDRQIIVYANLLYAEVEDFKVENMDINEGEDYTRNKIRFIRCQLF